MNSARSSTRIFARPGAGRPMILGVVNGLSQWIFSYPDRVSVTISGADRLLDEPREGLAAASGARSPRSAAFGPELAALADRQGEARDLRGDADPRTPRRPPAHTRWANVTIAGDWTQTGLPATIEGAVRSGYKAASILMERRDSAEGRGNARSSR